MPGASGGQNRVSNPPETGDTDSCVLPHGFWKLKPGPLEEWPVFLTGEPSLQFHVTEIVIGIILTL